MRLGVARSMGAPSIVLAVVVACGSSSSPDAPEPGRTAGVEPPPRICKTPGRCAAYATLRRSSVLRRIGVCGRELHDLVAELLVRGELADQFPERRIGEHLHRIRPF